MNDADEWSDPGENICWNTKTYFLREMVMEDAEGMLELDSDIKIRIAQISVFHIFLFIVEYYFSKSKTRFPVYFLELL